MHLALAKTLLPIVRRSCRGLDRRVGACHSQRYGDRRAAMLAVIDQFKILMLTMLIVSPLVLFLASRASPKPI